MHSFFYREFENEQNKDKQSLTFRGGDSNPRFSLNFLSMIWIFMEGEGDDIKSKQTSIGDRTLLTYKLFEKR